MDLDDLDRAILGELLDDARLSYRELARRLDVTAPTISRRVQRMEELGVIQGYRAVLAPERTGDAEPPSEVDVPCHWCDGPIHGPPVEARFDDRPHVFCCRQCRKSFAERREQVAEGV